VGGPPRQAPSAAQSGVHQLRNHARTERIVMLNSELNAFVQIGQLERERMQLLARSQALRAFDERRGRPVTKPPPLMPMLGRLWKALAIPRRPPAPRCAEAAA
jgi:hypothetical protein